MDQVACVAFADAEECCQGIVNVRIQEGIVALALSLKAGGDVEAFIVPDIARQISAALLAAADRAESATGGCANNPGNG